MVVSGLVLYTNCGRKTQPAASPQIETAQNATTKTLTAAIDELTKEHVVVPYVKRHGKLPDYYITKKEARNKGWIAADGNLCDCCPEGLLAAMCLATARATCQPGAAEPGTKLI